MTRRSGEARQAAPVVASMVRQADISPRSKMSRTGNPVGWQQKVKEYDRDGPGVLGYYLDTVALMASLSPLYPEVREPSGKWVRSDDPILTVAVAGFRSDMMSQADIVYAAVRGRESIGNIWFVADPTIGFTVTLNGQVSGTGPAATFQYTDGYGVQRVVSVSRVWRSWAPDPYDPWMPTSPVRRALNDLRRLRAINRNQTRSAESRLMSAGLMAFDPGEWHGQELKGVQTSSDGDEEELSETEQLIHDFVDFAKEGFADDDSVAASVPYPYIGKPAQYVEVGHMIDPAALEAERAATSAFARAVNFPEQLLTEGPGASNHWNEYLLQETLVKMGLAPKLQPVCDDITNMYLRGIVTQLATNLKDQGWTFDPNKVRIGYDLSFLLRRPARTAEMLDAYRLGIVTRQEVAAELGLMDLLEIPDGMAEYEHWELSTLSKGAPYAEVGPDGSLILPTPPPDPNAPPPDAGGQMQLPLGAPTDPTAGPPAALPPAPTAPSAGGVAEPSAPDTGGGQPVTAAPGPSTEDVQRNQVMHDASELDIALAETLFAITTTTAALVAAEVAKQVILTMPSRSPQRSEARSMPPDRLWASVDESTRKKINVDEIAKAAAEKSRDQINAAYEATNQSWVDQWGPAVATIVTAAAITAATNATVDAVAWWSAKAATAPVKAILPVSDIRSAMTVGGGAARTADGRLSRTASGTPQPGDGSRWEGNLGFLTGHNTVKALGGTPAWVWRHEWLRQVKNPFPPHVALDGSEFERLSDIPGGWFPQDHRGCSCGIQPVWGLDTRLNPKKPGAFVAA